MSQIYGWECISESNGWPLRRMDLKNNFQLKGANCFDGGSVDPCGSWKLVALLGFMKGTSTVNLIPLYLKYVLVHGLDIIHGITGWPDGISRLLVQNFPISPRSSAHESRYFCATSSAVFVFSTYLKIRKCKPQNLFLVFWMKARIIVIAKF